MKLYNGDCLEVMNYLIDNKVKVDCILTDPPYGINAERGSNGFGVSSGVSYSEGGTWDSSIPDKVYFDKMLKLSKKVIIFGGNYFTDYLPSSKGWIVWDKVGDFSFKNPYSDCELLYTNFLSNTVKFTLVQQGFVKHTKDIRCHPTQKPTELLKMIIEQYTSPEDLILDPFMGSGSTGRDFIGVEICKEFFDMAEYRVKDFQRNFKI